MIFVDASAFVAIITHEKDSNTLAKSIDADAVIACSAISIWETIAALCNSYHYSVPAARKSVAAYVYDLNFQYVPIGERESELGAEAYEKYGKGRHPAALNMGDCFAYACAKANNAKLLFKGDDFTKTDIAAA